jgi:VanZ family protein|tara:strand:- start:5288 stop:5635 length:348 start_codon:yes stop_codon:yes gene_type:complete
MKDPKNQFVAFLGLIILGSSIPGDSVPPVIGLTWDKLLHVLEYSIVGLLGYRAYFPEVKNPFILVIPFGILFGCCDEAWQSMIPGRFPSHYDVFADGIGVICGALTGSVLYKKLP